MRLSQRRQGGFLLDRRSPGRELLAFDLESLETRVMLATIQVFAAGETGQEQMSLSVAGQVVRTFSDVGGDYHGGQFQVYEHTVAGSVVPGQVRVGLVDGSPGPTGDKNLRVEKIRIDGVDYAADAPSVFVSGTWIGGSGCSSGNLQTDMIHCTGGFFQFAEPTGTTVMIRAAGATGEEAVALRVDGQVVQTWAGVGGNYNAGVFMPLVYTTAETITIGQVVVEFTNDGAAASGADRNLRVDNVTINGTVHEAEGANVLSQGHWIEGVGCAFGFVQAETLECGGYFDFTHSGGTAVVVRAAGATGEEQVNLRIDGQVVRTWDNVGGDYNAGQFEELTYVSSANLSASQVAVEFVNDGLSASGEDRNLRVDSIVLDGAVFEAEAASSYSVGHWLQGVGCASGFLQIETLHCPGYIQFAASAGSTVVVRAAGATGEEQIRLRLGGTVVKTWNGVGGDYAERIFEELTYVHSATVQVEDIVIEFSNDGLTASGADKNLRLDSVTIDGTVHEAEANTVYSNGHYIEGLGCVSGFIGTETLECGGFFDFDTAAYDPGDLRLTTTSLLVDESAPSIAVEIERVGGLQGIVSVDYHTFAATASADVDYTSTSGTLVFAPGVASLTVVVPILDDLIAESPETFSLTIDNPLFGASLLSPRTVTITIDDDEQNLASDLIAHWKLDEADVGSVGNSTSTRLGGTHRNIGSGNGPTLQKPLLERPNSFALDLDGVNDYVEITDTQALTFAQPPFTISIWMRSRLTNDGEYGLFHGGDNWFPSLFVKDKSNVGFQFGNGTQHQTLVADGGLDDGEWHMVTATFDGTTASLYVDGSLLGSSTAFAGYTISTPSTLHFGRRNGGYFNGNIDDVRIYTETLSAAEVASLFTEQLELASTIVTTLPGPNSIDWTPDGSMMFIGGFAGVVKVFENGQILSTDFIDIRDQVNGTRGLLDIAVHPDFYNQPYIYLAFAYDPPEVYQYTGLAGPDGAGNRASRLIRVTADAANNYRTAVPGSEVILLGTNSTWQYYNGFVDSTVDFDEPPGGVLPDGTFVQDFLAADSTTHTIGDIDFGPDGALYVANGDGTSYNQVDPRTVRVQSLDSLSGKILRIDPITGAGLADNPFFNGDPNANRSKVYQYGLRNPFRITFNGAGQLFVGDVGWYQYEELNSGPAGANFGWPYFEGGTVSNPLRTVGYEDLPEAIAFYASGEQTLGALVSLSHPEDDIDAIILGGFVAEPGGNGVEGHLYFGYLAAGFIRRVNFDSNGNIASIQSIADTEGYFTQLDIGPNGFLFTVDLTTGEIRQWEIPA